MPAVTVEVAAGHEMGEAACGEIRLAAAMGRELFQEVLSRSAGERVVRPVEGAHVRRHDDDAELFGEDAVDDIHPGEHGCHGIASRRACELRVSDHCHFDLSSQRGGGEHRAGLQFRDELLVLIQRADSLRCGCVGGAEVPRQPAFGVGEPEYDLRVIALDRCSQRCGSLSAGHDEIQVRSVPDRAVESCVELRKTRPGSGDPAKCPAIQRRCALPARCGQCFQQAVVRFQVELKVAAVGLE